MKTKIIESGVLLEKKLKTLRRVSIDANNYCTYYIDDEAQEKWIKEHPHSEMHAGGPPQLRLIDKFPWE
jgi:hypothetical protein